MARSRLSVQRERERRGGSGAGKERDNFFAVPVLFLLVSTKWKPQGWQFLRVTGGNFACACVNPLNDNSVGASNLMAGNRKLARKVTVLLKAISLVLWIPYFPTKNVIHDKNRTFSTRVFSCRFFSSRFCWTFKDFKRLNAKNHCSCTSLIFTGKAMHF